MNGRKAKQRRRLAKLAAGEPVEHKKRTTQNRVVTEALGWVPLDYNEETGDPYNRDGEKARRRRARERREKKGHND